MGSLKKNKGMTLVELVAASLVLGVTVGMIYGAWGELAVLGKLPETDIEAHRAAWGWLDNVRADVPYKDIEDQVPQVDISLDAVDPNPALASILYEDFFNEWPLSTKVTAISATYSTTQVTLGAGSPPFNKIAVTVQWVD